MIRRRAYTLAELLISLGVIALLIGLLMPVLAAARESARQVKCASNLRTLALAVNWYAQDNRGDMPGVAAPPQQYFDWVYWEPHDGPPFDDFRKGPLLRHLTTHESAVFRCPSDDLSQHVAIGPPHWDPYPYSYVLNALAPIERMACCTLTGGCRLWRVRRSSEMILMLEPSEQTLIDGAWIPFPDDGPPSELSDRHEHRAGRSPSDGRGNVAFVDSHVEFVPRSFARDPAHFLPN